MTFTSARNLLLQWLNKCSAKDFLTLAHFFSLYSDHMGKEIIGNFVNSVMLACGNVCIVLQLTPHLHLQMLFTDSLWIKCI